jgi:hypothetical protein
MRLDIRKTLRKVFGLGNRGKRKSIFADRAHAIVMEVAEN